VSGMQLTQRVELVFPRSGQTVAILVPVDLFDCIVRVNRTLLSFVSKSRACVPNELFSRQ
jgi:hypothetical protein